jgi:hypothetical protein
VAEVFLSYTRTDRAIAQSIAIELQRLGVDVWWDHELLGGDDYRARIAEILGRAMATIVIWSRRSIESQWVVGEASAAREKKTLVPINLDGTPVPLDFRPLHTIDFTGWIPGDQLPDTLLKGLGERLGRDLSYNEPNNQPGSMQRMVRRASQSWYLDFEGMLYYLIALGFASFLCTLSVNYIVHSPSLFGTTVQVVQGWMAQALAVLIGCLIAPLIMRPLLRTRKAPTAVVIIFISGGLSLVSYMIGEMLITLLHQNILVIVGPSTMLMLLTTSLAERSIRE